MRGKAHLLTQGTSADGAIGQNVDLARLLPPRTAGQAYMRLGDAERYVLSQQVTPPALLANQEALPLQLLPIHGGVADVLHGNHLNMHVPPNVAPAQDSAPLVRLRGRSGRKYFEGWPANQHRLLSADVVHARVSHREVGSAAVGIRVRGWRFVVTSSHVNALHRTFASINSLKRAYPVTAPSSRALA